MDGSRFFEGPEKLMEIWWKPLENGVAEITQNGSDEKPAIERTLSGDLRTIPRLVLTVYKSEVHCRYRIKSHSNNIFRL